MFQACIINLILSPLWNVVGVPDLHEHAQSMSSFLTASVKLNVTD